MIINKDIGIIGAGPAGMSAALYLARSKYSFEIIEKEMVGGKLNITTEIDNYPGIISLDGFSLGQKIKKQLDTFNIKITKDNSIDIVKENDLFKVIGEKNTYYFKVLILATGSKNKGTGIKNEDKYIGKGISFCAVCDGFFFKGKDVAVFAHDRKGYLEALYLSNIVKTLYLINDNNLDDEENNLQVLKTKENVVFKYPYKILDFIGEEKISGLKILNLESNIEETIEISCVFPFLGDIPSSFLFKKLNLDEKRGYLNVDSNMKTSMDGVYAIGDLINKPLKQVVTACSDGAIAATSAIKYLNGLKNGK